MTLQLPVSRLIQVSVTLSPLPAQGRNFGDLLIIGDSNVISGLQRIRDYSSLGGVQSDFGLNAPETMAATVYFEQSPKPKTLSIGRWLRTATAGQLDGAILTAAQSALSLFTAITSGGFTVSVDGIVHNVTALNFSTALNLNGVASAITTALSGFAVAVWNGSQFTLMSDTTGAGTEASGTFTFTGNPANLDTVTINGVVITFVTATPSGNQVLIGGSAASTAVNLNTFLQASVNPSLLTQSYSVNITGTPVLTVTYNTVGTVGNAIAIAKSSANITVSGADLAGGINPSSVSFATPPGSGQDVSSLLGWTA